MIVITYLLSSGQVKHYKSLYSLTQASKMHERLVIASCLCVIAAGISRKRSLRRKLERSKKRRLNSDVRWSDNEAQKSLESDSTQNEEEISNVDTNSEHTSTDDENSDTDSLSDDSESNDIDRKVSETLDQVLILLKRETEKNNDVCGSFARYIECKLRDLPEIEQNDIMHDIQRLIFKNAMRSLNAQRDHLVPELQEAEVRPDSSVSVPEFDEAFGGE